MPINQWNDSAAPARLECGGKQRQKCHAFLQALALAALQDGRLQAVHLSGNRRWLPCAQRTLNHRLATEMDAAAQRLHDLAGLQLLLIHFGPHLVEQLELGEAPLQHQEDRRL